MQKLLHSSIRSKLRQRLPANQVISDLIYRYAYSRDAGFYRLLPRLIVKARSVADISTIFRIAGQHKRTITFRAGGTSLSGQAISDDILVEVKQGWRKVSILNEGRQIRVQPGVVAAKANQHLASYGYRIGPDPGSIRSALMGGVVANNASGIGSGNHANSYETLAGMEMVLTNGLVLDTMEPQDHDTLKIRAPKIHEVIIQIRDRIRSNPTLKRKIRKKYKLKNTMGYSLNSFLDYEKPLDILAHLMVGSEGTLGFISSITLDTVQLQDHKATSLLLFKSLAEVAKIVPKLKRLKPYALELMDDAALKAIQQIKGLPEVLNDPIREGQAALLLEFQASDTGSLERVLASATSLIGESHPQLNPHFSRDTAQREKLWKARRELGPIHAATRPAGTTVLSEDVCFKVKDLSRAIKDLKFLFKHYHYDDAVIFGHAGDGNLHFKLSLDFSEQYDVQKYGEFMLDLAELVVEKYDGSLKAEHGTGRNMAPFVEREWGSEAYAIMGEIKRLLDPTGMLNPGTLIGADDRIHLKHIKSIPLVDPIIDKCIECGLCEPWCPSGDLTLTPRQRISVLREIEMLNSHEDRHNHGQKLVQSFNYAGVDTCATDGLCGLSCPVDIDTGLLMKQMRSEKRSSLGRSIAHQIKKHFAKALKTMRGALILFTPFRYGLARGKENYRFKTLTKVTFGAIPTLNSHLRATKGKLPQVEGEIGVDVIYVPSCLNRILGDPTQKQLSVPQAFKEVLKHAGINIGYPQKVNDLCCGLSFSSKGFPEAAFEAAIQTTEMLWVSSLGGKLPIIMDTSPCTNHMKHYDQLLSGLHLARWRTLRILDMVEYLHDEILDKLSLEHVQDKVVLHVTCSSRRMDLGEKMRAIAERCAREVIIPIDTGCCGFAGDRGLQIPELSESATAAESREVILNQADGHYSTSRTCEIGMSLSTDQSYQSLIYLVHKALITP